MVQAGIGLATTTTTTTTTTTNTSTTDNQKDSVVDKSKEETVKTEPTYFTILYDNETKQ